MIKKNYSKYFTTKAFINYLLFYRIILALILEYYIQNITRRGDTLDYLKANPFMLFENNGFGLFFDRTLLVEFIVGAVNTLVRIDIFTNILFCLLAYYGIRRFLIAVNDKESKYFKILLLVCFFPSFNIWSSVAGKEALTVFAVGVIAAEVVRFFQGEKFRVSILMVISLYLVFIVKEQYIPAILQLVLYLKLRQMIKLSWKKDLGILLLVFAINGLVLFYAKDKIDSYALNLHNWFRIDGRSTRARFFYEKYEFFKRMPYLMPLAMWGPTWEETKISFLHKISFIESGVLLGTLIYMIKDFVLKLFTKFKIYYQWLLLSVNVMGWLFIAQYMQGIMNPGAAVRYRANLHLLIAALCFSLSCVEKIKRNAGEE